MSQLEPLQEISRSARNFSTDFYKNVVNTHQQGNLIMSSLSAHMVLSMATYGAAGDTALEMRSALHLPADDNIALQGFENLIDNLNRVNNVQLKLANKIFTDKKFVIQTEYKKITANSFRSESGTVDFSKAEETAISVNKWCKDKTNDKIQEIIKADDITADTSMILLNAVYFKGNWKNKFKKENTSARPFRIDVNAATDVPTMFRRGKYVHGELPDIQSQFIKLPYANENIKMIIVLPNEINGLALIEENIDSLNTRVLAEDGFERDVELYLPKFKIESTIDLNTVFQNMNMREMFTTRANFTGISIVPVKVDKVIQKAFIEVNEEGSEAAAVTGIQMVALSMTIPLPKIVFKVDRPFYYAVVDESCDVILFSGRVTNIVSA